MALWQPPETPDYLVMDKNVILKFLTLDFSNFFKWILELVPSPISSYLQSTRPDSLDKGSLTFFLEETVKVLPFELAFVYR